MPVLSHYVRCSVPIPLPACPERRNNSLATPKGPRTSKAPACRCLYGLSEVLGVRPFPGLLPASSRSGGANCSLLSLRQTCCALLCVYRGEQISLGLRVPCPLRRRTRRERRSRPHREMGQIL